MEHGSKLCCSSIWISSNSHFGTKKTKGGKIFQKVLFLFWQPKLSNLVPMWKVKARDNLNLFFLSAPCTAELRPTWFHHNRASTSTGGWRCFWLHAYQAFRAAEFTPLPALYPPAHFPSDTSTVKAKRLLHLLCLHPLGEKLLPTYVLSPRDW